MRRRWDDHVVAIIRIIQSAVFRAFIYSELDFPAQDTTVEIAAETMDLEVESDLENGTTFTVRLRLHITEEEQLFFQGEHNDELGNLPEVEA